MKNVNITMKKSFFVTAIIAGNFIFGQVGINNESPKATLDVSVHPTDNTKPEGIIAPRLSGEEIKGKDAIYLAEQKGTIVYATSASSDAGVAGKKTINIAAEGYYYFDGTIWQKFNSGTAAAGTEPWYDVTTNTGATTNLQDIYQMGKVGVGFKTPRYNLEVGDNLNGGSYLSLSQSGTSGVGQSSLTYFTKRNGNESLTAGGSTAKGFKWYALSDTFAATPSAANALFLQSWTNGSNVDNIMVIKPNGNIGFGVALPTTKVHIESAGAGTGFRLVDGSQGAGKTLVSDGNGNASWQANSSTFVGFSAYYAGPTISVGVFWNYNFDTLEYITSGSFSNNTWTVGESGFYYVNARVWMMSSGGTPGGEDNLAIFINGSLYRFGTQDDNSPTVNSMVHLNAGDTLQIRSQFGVTAEYQGSSNTYFQAYKVGN